MVVHKYATVKLIFKINIKNNIKITVCRSTEVHYYSRIYLFIFSIGRYILQKKI